MPSQDRTKTLVLDTAPLLTSSLTALLQFSSRFLTTQDVIDEVRGKGQRERLELEWKNLDATLGNSSSTRDNHHPSGLQIREPSLDAISKIKEFANKTGDIAVLSATDIRVLALAYDSEVEANGTWRLRETLGGRRMGKDPEKKKARLLRKQQKELETTEKLETKDKLSKSDEPQAQDEPQTQENVENLDEPQPEPQTQDNPQAQGEPQGQDEPQDELQTQDELETLDQLENLDLESTDDNSRSGDWIIPTGSSSVRDHNVNGVTINMVEKDSEKPPTMQSALLTGDFAMQNVALQIGLNVLGVSGNRIRDIKTWVLRCYGCFKLCKDPTRKFCPTCGGATLTRVSITYTPSSPTGYVLHLNPNYQYRNRGTVYSIPSAKPGSASFEKGGAKQNKTINGATIILREDQKEFQNGLKSIQIQKQKEDRKIPKTSSSTHFSSFNNSWNDPDWVPPMLLGEKGRKSTPGNHHSTRYGKDGFPLIGFGRNPNEVRRCRQR